MPAASKSTLVVPALLKMLNVRLRTTLVNDSGVVGRIALGLRLRLPPGQRLSRSTGSERRHRRGDAHGVADEVGRVGRGHARGVGVASRPKTKAAGVPARVEDAHQ